MCAHVWDLSFLFVSLFNVISLFQVKIWLLSYKIVCIEPENAPLTWEKNLFHTKIVSLSRNEGIDVFESKRTKFVLSERTKFVLSERTKNFIWLSSTGKKNISLIMPLNHEFFCLIWDEFLIFISWRDPVSGSGSGITL